MFLNGFFGGVVDVCESVFCMLICGMTDGTPLMLSRG